MYMLVVVTLQYKYVYVQQTPLKSDILSGGLQLYSGIDVVCMLEPVVEVFVVGRGTVK